MIAAPIFVFFTLLYHGYVFLRLEEFQPPKEKCFAKGLYINRTASSFVLAVEFPILLAAGGDDKDAKQQGDA